MMYSEKAIQMLNVLIAGGLKQGITAELVKHLRGGHAPYISQETWLILADFLDSGCKRPPHRPATSMSEDIAHRNRGIKSEYRQLRQKGESQKIAYGNLAEKYKISEGSIHHIITEK